MIQIKKNNIFPYLYMGRYREKVIYSNKDIKISNIIIQYYSNYGTIKRLKILSNIYAVLFMPKGDKLQCSNIYNL